MKEAHPERKAEVQVKNHVCGHVCNPNSEFMAVALSEPDSEPARGHFACEHPLLLWKTCVAAAAAKLLQSCPTLCDPMDGSPPGSSVPGILQARTLEWVAISFSNA